MSEDGSRLLAPERYKGKLNHHVLLRQNGLSTTSITITTISSVGTSFIIRQ